MSLVDRLTTELSRLPGVGPKTALRLAYHLMKRPRDEARRLAESIRDVAEKIRPCAVCGSFTETEVCTTCSDPRRDRSVICVVEEAYEAAAILRSASYHGLFHVLGGHLSPLDGIGPEELNVKRLLERVREAEGEVREVILATNTGVEGEATAVYLESVVRPLGPRVTRLARGVPVGSDLEYVDSTTISEALAGRREM